MPTSLGYAILTLLETTPQTGYDIARQMKPSAGYVWQAQHSQIYLELGRLKKRGLLESKRVHHASRPARTVYSVTKRGSAELAKWITEPPQERSVNDEIVVKVFSFARIPEKESAELVRTQMRIHDERMGNLEQRLAALEVSPRGRPANLGEYAALRRAIGVEREYLSWCRWLLAQIKVKEPRQRLGRRTPRT
jgi:DNA-binding PadR family transcriptional regulator